MEALNKKEIRNQIEEIEKVVEDHSENWFLYSELKDELQQLKIMLEQNDVI